MNDPNDRYYLARYRPAPIQKAPGQALNVRPMRQPTAIAKDSQTDHRPIVVHIHQHGTGTAATGNRASHYQTMNRRGRSPQSFDLPPLPSLLQMTTAFAVALLMIVSASMFSIGLTSYSNSVDRVNQQRQPDPFLSVQ